MPGDNKDVVRQFLYQVINMHDPEARPDLFDTNYKSHFGGMPALDHEGWKQMAAAYFAGFPDLSVKIEDEVAEGDRVAVRWTWTATHQGDFMGMPATAKSVIGSGAGVYRVVNGKVAEEWVFEDVMGVMQQLGASPATETAAP
jgi:steroid delta-isomerase-like uncharacterized protein